MSENSLISIIIPIYNAQSYLKKCIDSIINQTYSCFQVLLIDDGSNDASSQLCDEFAKTDARISVIHQENQGVSSARNTGLNHARGQFVSFIDADDSIEKNYLETLINSQKENSADLVVSAFVWDKRFNRTDTQFYEENIYRDGEVASVGRKIDMGPWAKLYKRDLIGEDIRFNKDIKFAEDRLFIFEYLKRCKTVNVLPTVIYHYNIRNTNSAVKKFYPSFLEYMNAIYVKECEYIETISGQHIKEHERNNMIKFYYEWCLKHYIEHVSGKTLYGYIERASELFLVSSTDGDYVYSDAIREKDYKKVVSIWKKEHRKEYLMFKIKALLI